MSSDPTVVLLTTSTTHHLYFARELVQHVPLRAIVVETAAVTPPFETSHPFEALRDEYERSVLLEGSPVRFRDLADTWETRSVNHADNVTALRSLTPDVIIVFGTGRCRAPVLGTSAVACLNLHGGNPEHYRGLDTHLWAIYHNDFDNLVTTLHYMNDELDTGDIALQSGLALARGLRLHELRGVNTEVCLMLTMTAIECLQKQMLPRRRQVTRGRYYSFMPSALKEVCVRNFERRIAGL